MAMPSGEQLFEEKKWRTVGSNQQPLDSKSNALHTALPRKICEVGFKQFLYSAKVYPQCYTSLRHACIIILYENIIGRVVVYVNI